MCHPFSFIKISMVIPTEYISKQKEEFQYFLNIEKQNLFKRCMIILYAKKSHIKQGSNTITH